MMPPEVREICRAWGELTAMADSANHERAFDLERKLRELISWCEQRANEWEQHEHDE
jgi:hypothetical protein